MTLQQLAKLSTITRKLEALQADLKTNKHPSSVEPKVNEHLAAAKKELLAAMRIAY